MMIRSMGTWPARTQISAMFGGEPLPARVERNPDSGEYAQTGAVSERNAVLILKIIQRIDQRVQLVLRLAGFRCLALGKTNRRADGLPPGEEELLIPLADRGLLGRLAGLRSAEELREIDFQ